MRTQRTRSTNPRAHTGLPAVLRAEVHVLRDSTTGSAFPPHIRLWALDAGNLPIGDSPAEFDCCGSEFESGTDHGFRVDLLVAALTAKAHAFGIGAGIGTGIGGHAASPERGASLLPECDASPRPRGEALPPPERMSNALLLVCRRGALEPMPSDHAWWRAWREACALAGLPIGPFAVVTKKGWIDIARDQVVPVSRVRPRARSHDRPGA